MKNKNPRCVLNTVVRATPFVARFLSVTTYVLTSVRQLNSSGKNNKITQFGLQIDLIKTAEGKN